MWGALGQFKFNISTAPKESSSEQKYNYAEHPVYNSTPGLEFTGISAQKRNFDITLNHRFVDVDEQLKTLKSMAEKGIAYTLIIGGNIQGKYVIDGIRETIISDTIGKTLNASIQLSLTRN